MFASLLMLALILVGAFFESSVYVAEASYTSGVKILNQSNPNFEKAQNQFARATNLSPYRDVYYLANAQNLIFLSSIEAAKKEPNVQNINNWIAGAVNAGKAATNVSPNKAGNWSALAQIYNSIQPLGVQGTAQAAVGAWQKAIEKDSKNPALYVQLAASYSDASTILDPSITGTGADSDHDGLSDDMEAKLGSDPHNSDTNGNGFLDGDEVKGGFNPAGAGRLAPSVLAQYTKTDNAMLKQAEDALNKAISLKVDLPDSYIALARVFEKEQKLSDAKKDLDNAALKFPYNADIIFEQGRITYNNGDASGAEQIFNNVLKLQPKHADALFALGLIYEKSDPTKALDYYKKVREITGPNIDLDKRINTLENPAPPTK
jgi:tetratricopeptide (TPR) repeat protein